MPISNEDTEVKHNKGSCSVWLFIYKFSTEKKIRLYKIEFKTKEKITKKQKCMSFNIMKDVENQRPKLFMPKFNIHDPSSSEKLNSNVLFKSNIKLF